MPAPNYPAPDVDPDQSPTRALLINGEWCALLIGIIQDNAYQKNFDVAPEDWPLLEQRINQLILILINPD